ncbi:MAG: transcription elongation factor GreA [Lachnospiraceae bacterium]|nr:transcription elongation factor GreA [Lachnospiraceae bacterium]MBP5184147.1 transcription elongation factor GreA [Lachnospiraceae bacterium]
MAEEVKSNIITRKRRDELEAELEELKTIKRKEISEKIKEAREQGDLSENAEYDAAKEEQRDIEHRIVELENFLGNVEIIDEDDLDVKIVSVGSVVKVLDKEFDEQITYQIVGASEANILQNKISNESPLGKALIGHKRNEVVTVDAPSGELKYKILKIDKPN